VTQVLNLQTPIEVKQRGVDTAQMETFYRAKGIKNIVNYPINDSSEDSLHQGLLGAAQKLHQMYTTGGGKNSKIYVHCTSSCTRAPSAVNVYLCLYVRAHKFRDPDAVAHMIKTCHRPSYPNMKAVKHVISTNMHIQDAEYERIRKMQLEYLEKEWKRISKIHDDEEKRLLALLKNIEDDEAEKLRLLKLWEEQHLYYEHFADGIVDLNTMTEDELDIKCDDLFNLYPIPFTAKKGENYVLEKEIERLIAQMNITIPIIHVRGQVYLIGTTKIIIQSRASQMMVRVGGGYVPFDEYIPNNHRLIERQLLIHMIKS